jgi:hypothetical protein
MPTFKGAVTSYSLNIQTPSPGNVPAATVILMGSFVDVDSPGQPPLGAAGLEFFPDGVGLPPNSYRVNDSTPITINYWVSSLPGMLSLLGGFKSILFAFQSDAGPSGGSAILTGVGIAPGSKSID